MPTLWLDWKIVSLYNKVTFLFMNTECIIIFWSMSAERDYTFSNNIYFRLEQISIWKKWIEVKWQRFQVWLLVGLGNFFSPLAFDFLFFQNNNNIIEILCMWKAAVMIILRNMWRSGVHRSKIYDNYNSIVNFQICLHFLLSTPALHSFFHSFPGYFHSFRTFLEQDVTFPTWAL